MGRLSLKKGQRRLTFPVPLGITDDGCIIPTQHKLNKDGYFRRNMKWKGVKRLYMFHRIVWEATYGNIPEGFEVDHRCHNRACCNIKHLQCIDGSEHAILSNKERTGYKRRTYESRFNSVDTKFTAAYTVCSRSLLSEISRRKGNEALH